MSDIDLKKYSKLFSYLKFSTNLIKEQFLLSILFAFSVYYFLEIPNSKILVLIILLIFLNLGILVLVGYKRKKDIEEIKFVIKSIRKNRLLGENEISLSHSLKDLEGNIKAMSRRTQNDIANITKLANARNEFLGYVSHELRTPIFTIQGYLETLLNGAIDDSKVNRSFLEKAFHHSENLNNLLNDLIDISMIESGQMSLSFRYFNFHQFVAEIIEELHQYRSNNNVELRLKEFNEKIEVYGDREKLKQVMLNLITNALKYTIEGSVQISVIEKKKNVSICISDTGLGISEEELPRIFERFYRTERERESNIQGTGLGLAIVKHILEAHNSQIDVNSELAKGTEFSFKLKTFSLS